MANAVWLSSLTFSSLPVTPDKLAPISNESRWTGVQSNSTRILFRLIPTRAKRRANLGQANSSIGDNNTFEKPTGGKPIPGIF
jgi:hypothetical protein